VSRIAAHLKLRDEFEQEGLKVALPPPCTAAGGEAGQHHARPRASPAALASIHRTDSLRFRFVHIETLWCSQLNR